MSLAGAALLLGLFGVPLLLLQLGHRLRDRTPVQRRAFWGGVIGHSVGALITCIALLLPPTIWSATGTGPRVLAVYGAMLIGALVGMAIGTVSALGGRGPGRSGAG